MSGPDDLTEHFPRDTRRAVPLLQLGLEECDDDEGKSPNEDMSQLQRLLPQYEFLEILGRGGMGIVFKARQVSLNRLVAIKFLPGSLYQNDASFGQRFRNEAQTMARLNHPNIVNVHDFGEVKDADGNELLFIVMEYIEGTDVAKMMHHGKGLAVDAAQSITTQLCDALAYAHSFGVVHRDIKPANVLISTNGQVKVLDFGLAKILDQAGVNVSHTRSNLVMGTPGYVAPEAWTLGVNIDHRADLYAVGVMLYNMLTGKMPQGHFKLASEIVDSDQRLDQIITKAMQAEREQRFQTAKEIKQALVGLETTGAKELKGNTQTNWAKKYLIHLSYTLILLGFGVYMVWVNFSQPRQKKSSVPMLPSASIQANSGTPQRPPSPPVDTLYHPPVQLTKGQWTSLFNQPDRWPQIKMEDGWLRLDKKPYQFKFPDAFRKNYGMRARFIRHDDTPASNRTRLALRNPDGTSNYYQFGYGFYKTSGRFSMQMAIFEGTGMRYPEMITPVIAERIQPGREYSLMFAVIGDTIVARSSASYFRVVKDSTFAEGRAFIFTSEDISDIEVINLDGLTEAEALRLLDVDEKGNDLVVSDDASEKQ